MYFKLSFDSIIEVSVISGSVSSVRPLRVQEQVVKDEKGRKRFHGAFTGGFSAGYFNTVGSEKGNRLSFVQFFRSSANLFIILYKVI